MDFNGLFLEAVSTTISLACCSTDNTSDVMNTSETSSNVNNNISNIFHDDLLGPNSDVNPDFPMVKGGGQGEEKERMDGGGDTKMISDDMRKILEIVFFVVLSGGISILGCIANVINMVVFWRQVNRRDGE